MAVSGFPDNGVSSRVFVALCDALILTSMVRIIKASTKPGLHGDCPKVEPHADDLDDESESSEKELSDKDNEYRHGM